MKISSLFVILFLFTAFAKAQDTTQVKVEAPKIWIKALKGKTANLDLAKVKLLQVLEDSRCPKDVDCIWAGQAKVLIEITYENGTRKKREVLIQGMSKPTPLLGQDAREIFVYDLKPYPVSSRKIGADEYFLLLKVEK